MSTAFTERPTFLTAGVSAHGGKRCHSGNEGSAHHLERRKLVRMTFSTGCVDRGTLSFMGFRLWRTGCISWRYKCILEDGRRDQRVICTIERTIIKLLQLLSFFTALFIEYALLSPPFLVLHRKMFYDRCTMTLVMVLTGAENDWLALLLLLPTSPDYLESCAESFFTCVGIQQGLSGACQYVPAFRWVKDEVLTA